MILASFQSFHPQRDRLLLKTAFLQKLGIKKEMDGEFSVASKLCSLISTDETCVIVTVKTGLVLKDSDVGFPPPALSPRTHLPTFCKKSKKKVR